MDTTKTTTAKNIRELTETELDHVSGGKGDAPIKYVEYKLTEVQVSSPPSL